MFSAHKIDSLLVNDLPELRRFLLDGFGLPDDFAPFSLEVLHWKFIETVGYSNEPRSLVAREGDRMIGHVGLCPRQFIGAGLARPLSAVHLIDWYASPQFPSVGLMLMLKALRNTDIQYAVGGSDDGQKMAVAMGYECRATVNVYSRILRPLYRLRSEGSMRRRVLRCAKDAGHSVLQRPLAKMADIQIRRAKEFGPEILEVANHLSTSTVLAARTPDLLNHFLRYPPGTMSGWHITRQGKTVGFALANVVKRGAINEAKIIDCLLKSDQAVDWNAAISALVRQVQSQGADIVTCSASIPLIQQALRENGFAPVRSRRLDVRDKQNRLPRGPAILVSQLEGDHGYL